MSARELKPVGWFNPFDEYHGYQQVAPEFEGKAGTIPLYAIPAGFRILGPDEVDAVTVEKADKWLAQQYGIRPLAADLPAIRALKGVG